MRRRNCNETCFIWICLLASHRRCPGRLQFERAGQPGRRRDRAGARGGKPAAAGARYCARDRHAPRARDRDDLRAGGRPRAGGAGARRRHGAAGQTLAVLDDATLRASAEQAQAAVKAAENQQAAAQTNADLAASTLARYKQLQAQKSVSPQEMDEVTRRAEAAAAQVDALRAQASAAKAQESGARAMLGYARAFVRRLPESSRRAWPTRERWLRRVCPFCRSTAPGRCNCRPRSTSPRSAAIHKGMKINVSIDAAPRLDPAGTVAEIVPAADPASHSFLVKIDLPPSTAAARRHVRNCGHRRQATTQAIVVPRSAVVMRGSLACAYVLDGNGIAQLRYVTLGAPHGNTG